MKLNIGEIKSQVDQMNANLILKSVQMDELRNAMEELIEEDELEGKALEAAKNYFKQLHIPIIRGMIMAYDEIKKANTSYLNDLYTQVEADDGFYIDTDAVNSAIKEKQAVISGLEEKVSTLSKTMPSLAVHTQSYINQQQQAVVTLQKEQQKVIDFESIHGSHYHLANLYLENVSKGISCIQWKHFDKNYLLHKIDAKNLNWAKALNNGWKIKKSKKVRTDQVDYKKLNSEFWNRRDGYFDGNWWQDPEKLEEVTAVLKAEAKANGGISLEELISQYSAEEINLRLYALQALANALRTGNYDEDVINALTVAYYKEGKEFDIDSKKITVADLAMLLAQEKNIKGRKLGNWLEGGGLHLLYGAALIAVSIYGQNMDTIEQQVNKVKQIIKDKSGYETYKKWLQDEAGGVKIPKGKGWNKGDKTSIPDKAKDIANQIKAKNGVAPQGYKGGRTYKNIPQEDGAQKLPEGISYREYDVNPYVKGQNRGTERIVIGDDGSVWYTNDHYYTFTKIE
ncbi:T7SS effector LXG polymorphic toxin [Anaerosacchariphilus polymeriproducens]|uniref:LXG domain-containing protein n=1 Tax=Anaerosacchariphilus polymeriproducens TaxID=1812858 RepID=A0A371AZN3_9FIRM|nr:T7SS effector LXG polymorphic toxin [Anaerosacchariphilus polymeriproducens]RDU24940.1 hypothetical protein DWV06_01550 [Anaerosacchariphilus polymeriproducens]